MEKNTQTMPEARPIEVLRALGPDELLNPEEARIYAGLKSRQSIYNWLNDKINPLRGIKKQGWFIRKGDLDLYLLKRQNPQLEKTESSASDQVLRGHLARLIEVVQAIIVWKRACAVFKAAGDVFGVGGMPDEDWITSTFEEMNTKKDLVFTLALSLSEETLSGLRFMLPSIHSDLSLSEIYELNRAEGTVPSRQLLAAANNSVPGSKRAQSRRGR